DGRLTHTALLRAASRRAPSAERDARTRRRALRPKDGFALGWGGWPRGFPMPIEPARDTRKANDGFSVTRSPPMGLWSVGSVQPAARPAQRVSIEPRARRLSVYGEHRNSGVKAISARDLVVGCRRPAVVLPPLERRNQLFRPIRKFAQPHVSAPLWGETVTTSAPQQHATHARRREHVQVVANSGVTAESFELVRQQDSDLVARCWRDARQELERPLLSSGFSVMPVGFQIHSGTSLVSVPHARLD